MTTPSRAVKSNWVPSHNLQSDVQRRLPPIDDLYRVLRTGDTKRYFLNPLSRQRLTSAGISDAPTWRPRFKFLFCRFVLCSATYQPCHHRCCTFAHLLPDVSHFFFLFIFIFHLCPVSLRRPSLSCNQACLLGSPFASLDARAKWRKLRMPAQKILPKRSSITRMLFGNNQPSHQTDEFPSQLPSVHGEMSLPN